jgi:cation transport regulator ChaC
MKGYLEFKENMEKERTYKELADEIDDRGNDDLKELLSFFRRMHHDQYTGNIDESNMESVIDASKSVLKSVY